MNNFNLKGEKVENFGQSWLKIIRNKSWARNLILKQKAEFPVENIDPIITTQINTLTVDRIRHSKIKISPIGLVD